MIYVFTFLLAFCSIVYELLLGQSLSAFLGNTVLRYSMTIGLYMLSMGIGSLLAEGRVVKHVVTSLLKVEILLTITGGFSVIILLVMNSIGAPDIVFFLFAHLLIVLIGVLTGLENPFADRVAQPRGRRLGAIRAGSRLPGSILRHRGVRVPLLSLGGAHSHGVHGGAPQRLCRDLPGHPMAEGTRRPATDHRCASERIGPALRAAGTPPSLGRRRQRDLPEHLPRTVSTPVTTKPHFGKHYLVDFKRCDRETLERVEITRPIFLEAARQAKATVVGELFHQVRARGGQRSPPDRRVAHQRSHVAGGSFRCRRHLHVR